MLMVCGFPVTAPTDLCNRIPIVANRMHIGKCRGKGPDTGLDIGKSVLNRASVKDVSYETLHLETMI